MTALFGINYINSATPFRIYLLLLPIRVAMYGPALIALGKANVILRRSIGEIVINLITSYLLLSYFGYNGVALGSLIAIFCWTMPLNLKEIAKGFNVSIWQVFPFSTILKHTLVALLATPPLFLLRYVFSQNQYFNLFTGILLFTFTTLYLFHFFKFIDMKKFKHFIRM